ncbi:hypothetical protein JAAARDRAFT_68695 [Jaapia argillacea MUCL 33604]|uniref:MYND-type domain-containing protein n=1 Tax=Jaapia argillacea MUCL 33604 TaxID=933084 RepID=A0A067Q991_9AGAM|nr:hypothetical protein JAAARDRAFT_68695 [Jaapia argillacea MUCL 33604]
MEVTEQYFRKNPQKTIASARNESLPACAVVANLWQVIPDAISLGVLDVFFHHLSESKAPLPTTTEVDDAVFALPVLSLLGLGHIASLPSEQVSALGDRIMEAWPGIFEWCFSLYPPSVSPPSVVRDEKRDSATRAISFCWFSIAQNPRVRESMRSTPGAIELATRLWVREDTMKLPSEVMFPVPSALLDVLLIPQQSKMLSQIVQASEASPSHIAKLAVARLTAASTATPVDLYGIKYHTNLIFGLTCNPDHPLQGALFKAKVIIATTKSLVAATKDVDNKDPLIAFSMVRLCTYLKTFLEVTDGFRFVSQSLNAGLLVGLAYCGTRLSDVTTEERDVITSLISSVVSRYLVYHSVIRAAKTSMHTVKTDHLILYAKVFDSVLRQAWESFQALLDDRVENSDDFDESEKPDHGCANAECSGRSVPRESLMKCAGCQSVLYCSKTCQIADWKRGDHKSVCKALKQNAEDEKAAAEQTGETDPSKTDRSFFQFLVMRDTQIRFDDLRQQALRKFPKEPLTSMVVKIDYTVLPPIFTVEPLSKVKNPYLPSSNGYASGEAIIRQFRRNPGLGSLIFGCMPAGRSKTWWMFTFENIWSREVTLRH